MSKILFISGSQRNGNCKQLLEDLQSRFWLEVSTEVVYIRDFEIEECRGCEACAREPYACVKNDKMKLLLDKVLDADLVVLASPSYFSNVSGLTKTFIDRLYPCYFSRALKDKKFIYLYTCAADAEGTKKYLDTALYGFSAGHELRVLGSYAVLADGEGEFLNEDDKNNTLNSITQKIRENM